MLFARPERIKKTQESTLQQRIRMDDFVTASEIARRRRVSKGYVANAISRGELAAIRVISGEHATFAVRWREAKKWKTRGRGEWQRKGS